MSFNEQIQLLELENTLLNKQLVKLTADREYVRGRADGIKSPASKKEYLIEFERIEAKRESIIADIDRNSSRINLLRDLGDMNKVFAMFTDFFNSCSENTQPVDELLARGNELLSIVESITGMEDVQIFVHARATFRELMDSLYARSEETVRG